MNTEAAIQRLVEVCRRQHKSLSTERVYSHWLRDYCRFVGTVDAGLSSERKMEAWLTMLARKRDVSASTQNQAFNAVLFFYRRVLGQELRDIDGLRATRPDRVRYAPTVDEVRRLLPLVRDVGGYPTNLITRMLYGCGLRVSEPLNLRVKDLDLANSQVRIIEAKNRKDRVVKLPCSITEELRAQLDFARAIWRRDVEARLPVVLPHQLARKYPAYQFAWSWAWVFPMRNGCRHPRTGDQVRWHVLPCNVQRAVQEAAQKLELPITPHCLRHAYATHSLNRGVNIKALSEAMGHAQIETTAGYCHAEALSVPSPLELVG